MDIEMSLEEMLKRIKDTDNVDKKYNYGQVSMPEVESNIEEYIIPELQEPCRRLWSKNIFTFMCSNREDVGKAYIILEPLSSENNAIFQKMKQEFPDVFVYDEFRCADKIIISDVTKMSEEEITMVFNKLVSNFVMQDVPSKFYLTQENYLIMVGCYDEIPNPEYNPNRNTPLAVYDSRDWGEFLNVTDIPETIKIFNKDKMTKSFEDYVISNENEDRTDFSTGNVYQSSYFLKKHFDYINSKNSKVVSKNETHSDDKEEIESKIDESALGLFTK